MLFAPVEEVAVAEKIYNGLIITNKVIEKTIEDTWDQSVHEEGYQITKDLILEILSKPVKSFKWNDFELKSNGILGNYKKINSAYFGRNYEEGRRWSMDEVNHMASDIRFLAIYFLCIIPNLL